MKLDCTYPILAMPMNGVSDVDLAIVVSQAGAFPSISIFNYYREGKVDLQFLDKELERFCQVAGTSNILISMLWEELMVPQVVNLLVKHNLKFVELFIRPTSHPLWPNISKQIDILRLEGFNIFFKTTKLLPVSNFDSIILKGPLSAGRSFATVNSLEENYSIVKSQIGPRIIPSGGIGTSEQVKYFMDNNAVAIGIGTLLAASEESCVSKETKERIIQSTSADIQNIGPLNCRGLLFSKLDNDDDNNSRSLRAGIRGTSAGCIYTGNGIDYIDKILPVKDIIELLVKDL